MQAYSFLAHQSFQTGLAMYPLYPKLHAVHEIGHEMRWQERSCQFVFNPATTSCSIDEDMVGRTAFLSRHVSPRQIIRRTLQRYVCHIQILWARLWWRKNQRSGARVSWTQGMGKVWASVRMWKKYYKLWWWYWLWLKTVYVFSNHQITVATCNILSTKILIYWYIFKMWHTSWGRELAFKVMLGRDYTYRAVISSRTTQKITINNMDKNRFPGGAPGIYIYYIICI